MLILSPGGVVLRGRYHGKSVLGEALGCVIDEGTRPAILDVDPFALAFAAVRDGAQDAKWFDFAGGQAGFAAAHPDLSAAPLDKPDRIFAVFVTDDRPEDTRRDPVANVVPLDLGKMIGKLNPAVRKTPREWLLATPDRRVFKLRDGRAMSTRWYGAQNAPAIIVFGAIHKSTMADVCLANAAIACGRALLVIERPGLGASDAMRQPSYEAVADDVAEIAAKLELRDVTVYGAGTAASFALATAHRLGSSVKAVALNSPRIGRPSAEAPSRYGQVLWAMIWNVSGLEVMAKLLWQMRMAGSAQALFTAFSVNNDQDRRLLKSDGVLAYAAAQTNDAFHRSVTGGVAEFKLYQSGARFDPSLVEQPIRVWQGAEDQTLLFSDTQRALAGARNVTFDLVPGAGVMLTPDEANRIMSWLAGGWAAQTPDAAVSDGRLDDGL
jgi:pimeloyl-ACP methyl ester carboxylesterase